jgi:hypothetical protein
LSRMLYIHDQNSYKPSSVIFIEHSFSFVKRYLLKIEIN